MQFFQYIVYSIMKAAVAATHHAASLPSELYWKSMLPNTSMPQSIAHLLHPPHHEGMWGKGSPVLCPKFGFCYGNGIHGQINYSGSKLQDKPNIDIFFLETDLKFGHKMNLLFQKTSNQPSFLPRQVVKSIPFSSTKMAKILNKFGVKPGSAKAEVMKNTVEVCEEPAIKGEDKYCATSLESMLDFIILKLGKDIEALSTEANKNETKQQEYRIKCGVKKVGEINNLVVCHKLNYVYAVFYCHKIENTVAYTVSLQGADGSRSVKAVSVCHRDTSAWNPKHLAFQMLKVKPGSVPICHFLLQDSNIAWVPKHN